MKIKLTANPEATPVPAGNIRIPLGQRGRADINHTLLRVVGKTSTTPALDVAAFQSFAD